MYFWIQMNAYHSDIRRLIYILALEIQVIDFYWFQNILDDQNFHETLKLIQCKHNRNILININKYSRNIYNQLSISNFIYDPIVSISIILQYQIYNMESVQSNLLLRSFKILLFLITQFALTYFLYLSIIMNIIVANSQSQQLFVNYLNISLSQTPNIIETNSDLTLLALGYQNGTIQIWKYNSPISQNYRIIQILNQNCSVDYITISEDLSTIISINYDSSLFLIYKYDVSTNEYKVYENTKYNLIDQIIINNNSNKILCIKNYYSITFFSFDTTSYNNRQTIMLYLYSIAASLDFAQFITGDYSRNVQIFRYNSQTNLYDSFQNITLDSIPLRISYNSNYTMFLVSTKYSVFIYRLDGSNIYNLFQTILISSDPASLSAKFSPDDNILYITYSTLNMIIILRWNNTSYAIYQNIYEAGVLNTIISYDNSILLCVKNALTLDNTKIYIFDPNTSMFSSLQNLPINVLLFLSRVDNKIVTIQNVYSVKFNIINFMISFWNYQCLINWIYNSTTQLCQINCPADINSIGTAHNLNSCNCKANFTWNFDFSACTIDCRLFSNVGNATNIYSCDCIYADYSWSPLSNSCFLNCSLDPYSIGIRTNECLCVSNFIWNYTIKSCYVDCPAIKFAKMNLDFMTCICNNLYLWNSSFKICQFNCSALNNSIGNKNIQQCQCYTNYWFNKTVLKCQYMCILDPNSNGININESYCICNQHFYWSSVNGRCQLNCTEISHAYQTKYLSDNCTCSNDYSWDSINNICQPICGKSIFQVPSGCPVSMQLMLIIISCSVGVSFIVLVILYYKKKKCNKRTIIPQGDINQRNSRMNASDLAQINQINSNNQIKEEQLVRQCYPVEQYHINVDKQSKNCSICLEQGDTNVTNCYHYFHISCLLAWAKRTRNCPNCRNTDVKILKNCATCKKYKLLINMCNCFKRNHQKCLQKLIKRSQNCSDCKRGILSVSSLE